MTEPVYVDVPRTARLEMLDYLRFIAAAAVLLSHYFASGISNGGIVGIEKTAFASIAKYGYLGVHLFFLISGFVIFRSAHGRSARSFAVGRAVRLYPAFWVAVLATATVIALWGDISGLSVSPRQVLVNLTMAPGVLNVGLVDGVYWTLLLEVYFYIAIFVLLLLGQGGRLGVLIPWWIMGQFVVLLAAPQLTSVIYLGDSFVLFSLGALISEIYQRGVTPVRAVAFALGIYMVSEWGTRNVEAHAETGVEYSDIVVTAVTLACVAMLMAAASKRVSRIRLPQSEPIGAITYPLYLIHASIGYIALSHLATVVPVWLDYSIVIAGGLLSAYLLHVVVELRQKSFWFRFFGGTVGRAVDVLQRLVGAVTARRRQNQVSSKKLSS